MRGFQICFGLFLFTLGSGYSECPANSESFIRNDKRVCVDLQKEKTSWFRAKRKCILKGQKLLELSSEGDDSAMEEILSRFGNVGDVWIGGENHADKNVWVWASLSSLVDCALLKEKTGSDNLCTGSETDNSLRCLALHTIQSSWTISDCQQEKYFFCQSEVEADSAPETELTLESEQGYVELKSKILDHDSLHVIEITLAFSTYAENGLLLWQGTRDSSSNNFVAIAIEDGYTTVNVGNTVLQVMERRVSDGEIHHLRLLKSLDNITLTVDRQYTQSSLYSELDNEFMLRQPVYLGGHHQSGVLYPTGFKGCIHHFGTENLCREEALECTQFGQSPLDFRSRASGHIMTNMYEAVSTERCQLPPLSSPTFGLSLDGSSFAELKSSLFSPPAGQSLHIDLLVTTTDPDGLLLSLGQELSDLYIVLELVAGRPVARWRLSAGPEQQLVSKNSLASGLPVNLTLGVTNDQIYLRAGRNQLSARHSSRPARLPSAPVYVGGSPHHQAWLRGCLSSLFVTLGPDRRMIHFSRDSRMLNATTNDMNCLVHASPMSTTTVLTPTRPKVVTTPSTPPTTPTKPNRPPSYGLFSNGSGHAELWSDEELFSYDNPSLSLEILVTTISPSGLIFFQGESWDNRLLAIGVHDGRPYTDFNFGGQTIKNIQSPVRIDDGEPSLLSITVSRNVSLEVRGVLSSRPTSSSSYPSSVIYITGLPDGHGLKVGKYSNSFSGCISTFLVTSGGRSQYVDFRQQVTDTEDSGVSVEDDQCRAAPQALTTSTTLRPDNLGLSLSGEGWAEIISQTPINFNSGLSLELLLDRMSGDGLLLWLGQFDEYQGGHYISISLRRAKSVLVEWKFGDEIRKIRHNLDLKESADTPLYIRLRLSGRKVHFTVDSVTKSKDMEGSILPSPPLYIGGAPQLESITGRKHNSGFVGCIHSIKLQDSLLDFNKDFNLFNMDNELSCMIEAFPSRPKIPSTSTTIITTPSTTTTEGITTPSVEKMRCQDDEKLTLNGRGYFELNRKVVTSKPNSEVEIEIHIQTSSVNGIVLQKKSKRTNDSITIELDDGYINFRIFYGRYREGFEIKSNDKYNDGEEHVIKANKLENGGGSLQVDGAPQKKASINLGGRIDHLDTSRAPVYLGWVPGGPTGTELRGCITHLRFWNIPKDGNQYGSERLSAFGTIIGYGGSNCALDCNIDGKTKSTNQDNSTSILDQFMDIWS